MRVVILKERVSIGHFVRESVDMRDVVRITCIFSSLSFIDTLFLYFRCYDHFFFIHCTYLLYMWMYVSFTYLLHVFFLFSLYAYASYTCMQSINSVSHKDALMSLI